MAADAPVGSLTILESPLGRQIAADAPSVSGFVGLFSDAELLGNPMLAGCDTFGTFAGSCCECSLAEAGAVTADSRV